MAPQTDRLTNPVKAKMQAGEVALGMPVRLARSGDIAPFKTSGHDFIFIDCQHSLFDLVRKGCLFLTTHSDIGFLPAAVSTWTAGIRDGPKA